MRREQDGVVRSAKYDLEGDGDGRRSARGKRMNALISVLVVIVALLVLLIADGVRRENSELRATLESFTGEVTILKNGQEPGRPPDPRMSLAQDDVVVTGATGAATIVFADGSAIQVEKSTRFVVEIMAYARTGVRNRSFLVEYGSAVSRVSKFFGAESRSNLRTPTAVAAARGTGYRTRYHDVKRLSELQVAEGTVSFLCGESETPCGAGYELTALDTKVGPLKKMTRQEMDDVRVIVKTLALCDHAPSALQNLEWWLTGKLDVALRALHIGPPGIPDQMPIAEGKSVEETAKDIAESMADQQPEKPEPETEITDVTPAGDKDRPSRAATYPLARHSRGPGNPAEGWTPHLGSFDQNVGKTRKSPALVFEEMPAGDAGGAPPSEPESSQESGPRQPSGAQPAVAVEPQPEPVQTQVLSAGPIETVVDLTPTAVAAAAGAGARWLIPSIVGAGAAAAALSNPGGAGQPPPTPPVPEPAGLLALGASVGAMLIYLRRRR